MKKKIMVGFEPVLKGCSCDGIIFCSNACSWIENALDEFCYETFLSTYLSLYKSMTADPLIT